MSSLFKLACVICSGLGTSFLTTRSLTNSIYAPNRKLDVTARDFKTFGTLLSHMTPEDIESALSFNNKFSHVVHKFNISGIELSKLTTTSEIVLESNNLLTFQEALKLLVWIDAEKQKELEEIKLQKQNELEEMKLQKQKEQDALAKKVYILDEGHKFEEVFKNNPEFKAYLKDEEFKCLVNGSGVRFKKFDDIQNGACYTAVPKTSDFARIQSLESIHRNKADVNIARYFSSILHENVIFIQNDMLIEDKNEVLGDVDSLFKSENADILLERKSSVSNTDHTILLDQILKTSRNYESIYHPKRIICAVYCPSIADDIVEKLTSSGVHVLTDQVLFYQAK